MPKLTQHMPKRFYSDREWADKHYSELQKKYPNKRVAILNKKVVGVSDDTGNFLEKAKKKTKEKHIPTIWIESGIVYY